MRGWQQHVSTIEPKRGVVSEVESEQTNSFQTQLHISSSTEIDTIGDASDRGHVFTEGYRGTSPVGSVIDVTDVCGGNGTGGRGGGR